MEEPLNVAILGLGLVGEIHLRAYDGLPGLRVIAVADPDPRRLEAVSSRTGVRTYSDHLELLAAERVDIACVCTPAATHASVTAACAAAGVHVLCEKPLAATLADARKMVTDCAAAGVHLGYAASYRHLPAIIKAHEMIRAGELGELKIIREQLVGGSGAGSHQPMGPVHYPVGGPGGSGLGLVDHGVHLIDLFRWFADSPVCRAFGRGNVSGGTPSTEFLHVEFKNGMIGQLLYNDETFGIELPYDGVFSLGEGWDLSGPVLPGRWLRQPGLISVYGARGSLRIHHYANLLYFNSASGLRQIPLGDGAAPKHFAAQLQAFACTLRSGSPHTPTGEDGVAALEILYAAYGAAVDSAAGV